MKLGLALPWANSQVDIPVRRVQLAERLGFDSVWTAEIYGQDAITPLAFSRLIRSAFVSERR